MKKFFYLLLCAFLAGCSSGGKNKSVTIASKLFTENILLSEMYAQLIESHTDIEVVRKQALGGTPVCYTAMQTGEVDIYVEYTGTLYTEILKHEYAPNITSDDIYDIVKKELSDKESITIYQPIGLNNTFALAMQEDKADAFGIKTISDLGLVAPNLIFAANNLYYPRINDGYDALTQKYGFYFKSTAKMDTSLIYDAIAQGQVDVMVVYATDSLLKKYNLVILEDDKQLFPDYRAIPIIRDETLKKHPELNDVLNLLAGRIDDERMQELNYLVDVENKQPEEVVKTFLTEEGLLK